MSPSPQHQNLRRQGRQIRIRARLLGIVPLVLGIVLLPHCARRRDPQAAYDHARQTLSQGSFETGALEAQEGYKEFHSLSAEWAWKFTILRARAQYQRGMYEEVLSLLASEPAPTPSGELAVQKLRWRGLSLASLRRFGEAEDRFNEAERLCSTSGSRACTDIVHAQGTLEMDRGHYAAAQRFFARVLPRARASGDRFWEASTLLDLSWSANEQTHFDEALDWADAARQISLASNFADFAQTALGNMGWAYYKLGDPEKAEGMFIEAKQQAEKLGDLTDQVTWLQAIGYIYLDAGKFDAAEESYQRALALAQHTNREDIIDSLTALAFVSERTGKLDDAKRYSDEALAKAREDKHGREQVYPLLVQGRVAARLHDPATAETAFREVAQSQDSPVFL